MKKIGNKVFLMIIIFVLIFGLNTVFSIRAQNSIKQAGLQITKQYIPIQKNVDHTCDGKVDQWSFRITYGT